MIAAANFSFSSSIPPPWPTLGHSNRRNTPPRAAVRQIGDRESNSVTQQSNRRRCVCYDMHKELVPFAEAWSWQKSIVEERKTLIQRHDDGADALIVLQHHPVYTLGAGSTENNLSFDIKDPPFPVYQTERGGEVTYHGPGQLVMYPIMNLRYQNMDLHWYLRALEEVVIRALFSTFSLKASRIDGLTGVWVGDEKVAAIGIRVSRWLTFHGLAVNVATDLSPFRQIVPCGIRKRGVGSIKGLVGCGYGVDDGGLIDMTHESLVKEFCEVFQVQLCLQPPSTSMLKFPV